MNFHELRILVNQIKRNMRCPICNGKYTDENIEVIGSINLEESFFHAYCPTCQDESCIHVDMHFDPLPDDLRMGWTPHMEHVSVNEVLDMHNFLKGFKGNFKDLFKHENPR